MRGISVFYIVMKMQRSIKQKKPRVLFFTEAGGSYGMGHLRRCLSIIEEGKSFFDGVLCIDKEIRGFDVDNCSFLNKIPIVKSPEDAGNIDLVFSDRRDTTKTQIRMLSRFAPVISLDDLGAGRMTSHISIFSLPTPRGEKGNLNGNSYIVLDSEVRHITPLPPEKKKGVLVSFGGSDPANLTFQTVRFLNELGIIPIVVKGPFFSHSLAELNAEVLEAPHGLGELLNRAELLITSFGLTMYEAFFLGTPVVLYNQSFYHFQLSKNLDIPCIGYRGIDEKRLKQNLKKILEKDENLKINAKMNRKVVDGFGAFRLASVIKNALETGGRRDCFFNHNDYISVVRNEKYSLFRCRKCGDLFNYCFSNLQGIMKDESRNPESKEVSGASYFLSEYKMKYGRTYIKDSKAIRELGKRRLSIIENLLKKRGKLLDVGCALGFFLEMAEERGWEATGVELFPYAVQWGKRRLGLNIQEGSFLSIPFKKEFFDAVTFFFVLEHFVNTENAIEKAAKILKCGGVFACSLPNRGGISYRLNRNRYLEQHPDDHYIDTDVKNLKKLLRWYGLKTRQVVVTGIHPSRFYSRIGMNRKRKLFDCIYTVIARLFRLGDTFELYAVKVG